MKTTKEFPATHSMGTEWFIADAEGNIALFDFDDDGPVPAVIADNDDFWVASMKLVYQIKMELIHLN